MKFAKGKLERGANERYTGLIVRPRIKRVPKESVKCYTFAHEGELQRFLSRYVEFVKSLEKRVLQSNGKIREAFRAHFRGRFARLPDLPIKEFRSYLANFPCFQKTEAAGYEGLVAECEIHEALK